MLVLSRKVSEVIRIGDDIVVTIVRIGPNTVRVGVDAPKHINIAREELVEYASQFVADGTEIEVETPPTESGTSGRDAR